MCTPGDWANGTLRAAESRRPSVNQSRHQDSHSRIRAPEVHRSAHAGSRVIGHRRAVVTEMRSIAPHDAAQMSWLLAASRRLESIISPWLTFSPGPTAISDAIRQVDGIAIGLRELLEPEGSAMSDDFPQTRIPGKAGSGVHLSLPVDNRSGRSPERYGQTQSWAPRAELGLVP